MGIVVRVRITGAKETLAAFRKLPKDASTELRNANQQISTDLAGKIRSAATSSNGQGALVAPTVKAKRDRVPSVQAGGRRRAGKQSRRSKGQAPTTASDLIYGSNFGANVLKQFPATTKPDHWFFSTVEDNEPAIERQWLGAVDKVLEEWGNG
ncbi:hypothetical protein [Kribbella jiaozuonensis]|uniref:HK97 gp10 family phage protein n=1 Tax=Kribbella jiaozuonensis TaxID=2575441 RepID=A0A4U3LWX2_9ACTN|nr:hypothetical protein [Kribbella jiaozuonensis]TKK79197.1 hypothetical protein FDA38_12265 [Kribbella jiaozuonensis]TKK83267.1 hypothetical protein FDA38_11220 [Kribbella jiaozuonensis]